MNTAHYFIALLKLPHYGRSPLNYIGVTLVKELQLDNFNKHTRKEKNISPAPTPQQMPGLPVIAFDIRQGHAWSLTAPLATPHHHLGPELQEEIKSTEQRES